MKRFILLLNFLCFLTLVKSQTSTDNLPELIPILKNGKFGYANRDMKIVIVPKYTDAEPFMSDDDLLNSADQNTRQYGSLFYATVKVGTQQHRIDNTGKIVYTYKPADFEVERMVAYYDDKYIVFEKDKKFGIKLDTTVVVPAKFEQMECFTQYCSPPFIAKLNGKFGLINSADEILVKFKYDKIINAKKYYYGNLPLLKVKSGDLWFYVDYNGVEYRAK